MIVSKVQHIIKSEVGNSLENIFVKFLHIDNKVIKQDSLLILINSHVI